MSGNYSVITIEVIVKGVPHTSDHTETSHPAVEAKLNDGYRIESINYGKPFMVFVLKKYISGKRKVRSAMY